MTNFITYITRHVKRSGEGKIFQSLFYKGRRDGEKSLLT